MLPDDRARRFPAGIWLRLEEAEPVASRMPGGFAHERSEQQIRDVVRQRAPDQEFHREVIDALRVLAFVGLIRVNPSLGQDIADGAGERLVALAWPGGRRIGNVVEQQVAVIERVSATCEVRRLQLVVPQQTVQCL